MGENIEVKDVQKTEYLDKNGLDMLWAKVKENTHNQVEVERNRAVAKENSIIDTKADKSEFSNYVSSATFAVLEKKVSANTAAISNNQNAGKYIPYETFSNDTYYLQNGVAFGSEQYAVYTSIKNGRVLVRSSTENSIEINGDYLFLNNEDGNTIALNSRSGKIEINRITSRGSEGALYISGSGIHIYGVGRNRVLTADATTIDITQYALKSELPTVPTKVSQLQNDSEFITKSVYDEKIAALEARIAALEAKHTETA